MGKGALNMVSDEKEEAKSASPGAGDKISFKTADKTYSFDESWVGKKALKDILVDLISEDYEKQKKDKK